MVLNCHGLLITSLNMFIYVYIKVWNKVSSWPPVEGGVPPVLLLLVNAMQHLVKHGRLLQVARPRPIMPA